MDVEAVLGDIAIPTKMSSMTRPCACGLTRWPKRLFGFNAGTMGEAPSSDTVFGDPGGHGLPPIFTRLSLSLALS